MANLREIRVNILEISGSAARRKKGTPTIPCRSPQLALSFATNWRKGDGRLLNI
jgi:hypothetical protein